MHELCLHNSWPFRNLSMERRTFVSKLAAARIGVEAAVKTEVKIEDWVCESEK
jgi:hypothetical protein